MDKDTTFKMNTIAAFKGYNCNTYKKFKDFINSYTYSLSYNNLFM